MPYPADAPIAFASETLTVAGSSVGFTAATIQPSNAGGAVRAVAGPLESGQIRYWLDGTAPTATAGHLLDVADVLVIEGYADIAGFRAIRTGGVSGSLPTTFFR